MSFLNNKVPPVFRIPNNDDHDRVSALFLGPKAENAGLLQEFFSLIVQGQSAGRKAYFPDDPDFIAQGVQQSPAYVQKTNQFRDALTELLGALNKYSIPFYSPRYSAHMCVDQSMPAILGYLSTMFYNPNNVAFEASPFTTQLELKVGQQMAQMMGYNIDEQNTEEPLSWGHITCDGTVANLESLWAARNLKFYPLSLRDASAAGAPLEFMSDTFNVTTCKGTTKLLKECSTWELLNLPVKNVVEIPERLYDQYEISGKFLDDALHDFLVQTTNKDELMKKWGIDKQPVLYVPSTKHYSWPKAAAIGGIGSENARDVPVDVDARINTDILRQKLQNCITEGRAVYMVVAVMGTTEEGAVDRLGDIIKIRDEMAAQGLSFVVHADAAWGAYFSSMLQPKPVGGLPRDGKSSEDFVPQVGLRLDTAKQLRFLKDADSITIDPHKAGYIPYPAGGLCYRDGRMRYLVTWTAPYINQGVSSGESIGVYGVEGSKPGAAAAAVYLHHQVVGLGPDGHGSLLGEAAFTCRRFSSHWAAMSDQNTPFIVVPFNPIPAEKDANATPASIQKQKTFIRTHIIGKTNTELVKDKDAMILLNQLGSDLNINAFACNFRYSDGRVNDDILEANWLNRRIFERLSVTDPDEDPLSIPFYLTSTVFAEKDYGECADEFKRRLGLKGKQDLFVLRNVVMSPFATTNDFVAELAGVFQQVLEEEIENVRRRNVPVPEKHTFIVQGTDKLHFVHMPSFHMASGRRQLIFTADVPPADLKRYQHAHSHHSGLTFVQMVEPMLLDGLEDGAKFEAEVSTGHGTIAKVQVNNVKIIKKRSLDTEDLDSNYPSLMPFYLYGTPEQQHIDHVLLLAPNIQLTSSNVKLSTNQPLSAEDLSKGVIAVATNVHERSMQPFPEMKNLEKVKDFFFKEGKTFDLKIYRDPFPASTMDPIPMEEVKELITEGALVLGNELFIDSDRLNADKELAVKSVFDYDSSGSMSRGLKNRWIEAVENFECKLAV